MRNSKSSPTHGSPLLSFSELQISTEATGPSGAVRTGSQPPRKWCSKKSDAVVQDHLGLELLTHVANYTRKDKELKTDFEVL